MNNELWFHAALAVMVIAVTCGILGYGFVAVLQAIGKSYEPKSVIDLNTGVFISGPNFECWVPDFKTAKYVESAILHCYAHDEDDFTFTDLANVQTISKQELEESDQDPQAARR